MTTSRPDLANEIWLMVISLVPRKDLPSLSLVSKRLHDLTESVLYLDIDTKKNKHRHPSLVLFLRTILEKPRFASYVKNLELRVPASASYETNSSTLRIHHLTYAQRSLAKKLLSQSPFSERLQDRWHKSIISDEENWDAIAAFVVFLVSGSLLSLTMENYGIWSEYSFMDDLLQAHVDSVEAGIFPCLKSVKLYDMNAESGMQLLDLSAAIPYLKLPSITSFVCYGLQDTTLPPNFKVSPSITSLSLADCGMYRGNLDDFLKSFAALNSLHWTDIDSHCEITRALSNLTELKSHLEELTVDAWKDQEKIPRNLGILPFLLTDFTALKTFTVDRRSAFGALKLPVFEVDEEWEPLDRFDSDDQALFTPKRQIQTVWPHERQSTVEWFKRIDDDPQYCYSDDRISAFRTALPESIESLTITSCHGAMFDCALYLVTSSDGRLCNLKNLTLSFVCPPRGRNMLIYMWDEERRAHLLKTATEHGINLVFTFSLDLWLAIDGQME